MSTGKHHWRHTGTDQPGPGRLTLAEPLIGAEAVVRELHRADADLVAEAARNVDVVRGEITLPYLPDEADAMLAEFEDLRADGQANLYGVLRPDDHALAGVISLRVGDGMVAEGALWNQSDKTNREVTAAGVNLLTAYAHRSLHIVQVWVLIDPLDPFTRRLASEGGWTQDTDYGTGLVRLSSVG